jgi:threonine synthase
MDLAHPHDGSDDHVKFVSTRGVAASVGIAEALEKGLASDGGLFVPENFPPLDLQKLAGKTALAEIGAEILRPFFSGDTRLAEALPEITREAFSFPTPVVPAPGRRGDFILELYHGPTSAFKDVGARFLASALTRGIGARGTVIVATSGDTGGAVAGAFFGKPGIDVVILFPKGMVSPRQEAQLCAWGGNIRAFAVDGNFDDCQRVVKEALLDRDGPRNWLSANSINLGRIFPQMVYYAKSALEHPGAGFIIPTGNLGNALAAFWAKKIGLPLGPIVFALNANRGIADYVAGREFGDAKTVATLANAMDVGSPSNLERLRNLAPELKAMRAESVSDEEIRAEIRSSEKEWGQPLCPHTATAAVARKRIGENSGTREWILVSTAHPAKFESIVEPLIGHAIEVPAALAEILRRPAEKTEIAPRYADLLRELEQR